MGHTAAPGPLNLFNFSFFLVWWIFEFEEYIVDPSDSNNRNSTRRGSILHATSSRPHIPSSSARNPALPCQILLLSITLVQQSPLNWSTCRNVSVGTLWSCYFVVLQPSRLLQRHQKTSSENDECTWAKVRYSPGHTFARVFLPLPTKTNLRPGSACILTRVRF